jgi:Uma2 family endonuclease
MNTILKLGSTDHGRPVDEDELESAEFEPGFNYEIIDGRLYVSPIPNLPENRLDQWLLFKLYLYSRQHLEIVNYISSKARVFVPDRPRLTVPEPDVAAYHNFPIESDLEDVNWREISPILVAEVMTGNSEKDLDRNVKLYWQVPSIREYWVVDGRASQSKPTLIVHRRYGKRWLIREYPYATTYTTRLLPEFELRIDPRS